MTMARGLSLCPTQSPRREPVVPAEQLRSERVRRWRGGEVWAKGSETSGGSGSRLGRRVAVWEPPQGEESPVTVAGGV